MKWVGIFQVGNFWGEFTRGSLMGENFRVGITVKPLDEKLTSKIENFTIFTISYLFTWILG